MPISDLSEFDFKQRILPYAIKNEVIAHQLTRIFVDYFEKWRKNQFNSFLSEKFGKSKRFLNDEEFVRRHGEEPWNIINRILKQFDSVPVEVAGKRQAEATKLMDRAGWN